MDNWSIEYIIMISPFVFILVLFGFSSVFENIKRDEKKKKQPYMSTRDKMKHYNKAERRNK